MVKFPAIRQAMTARSRASRAFSMALDQLVTHHAQEVGLAPARQTEGQHVDSALGEMTFTKFDQLSAGTRFAKKLFFLQVARVLCVPNYVQTHMVE